MTIHEEPLYLIWSYEHNAWWGPLRCGYVEDAARAGCYTTAEAGEIVVPHIPPGHLVAVPVVYAVRWRELEEVALRGSP